MQRLTIYYTSSVAQIASENSRAMAEMNQYCKIVRAEILLYGDKARVNCGVTRTYKVPASINDATALTSWLKGRIAATERAFRKSPIYQIMNR